MRRQELGRRWLWPIWT